MGFIVKIQSNGGNVKACKHELRRCANSTSRCTKCDTMFVEYTKSESYLKRLNMLKTENAMLRSCLKRLGAKINKRLEKGFGSRRR